MKSIFILLVIAVFFGLPAVRADAKPLCNLARSKAMLAKNKLHEKMFSSVKAVKSMERRRRIVKGVFEPIAQKQRLDVYKTKHSLDFLELDALSRRDMSIIDAVRESIKISGLEISFKNSRMKLASDAALYGFTADQALAAYDAMQSEMIKQGANTRNSLFKWDVQSVSLLKMLSTLSPSEILSYQRRAKMLLGPITPPAWDEVLRVHLMTGDSIESIVGAAKSITSIAEFAEFFDNHSGHDYISVGLIQNAAFSGKYEVEKYVLDWKARRSSFVDTQAAYSLLFSSVTLAKTVSELQEERMPKLVEQVKEVRAELKLPRIGPKSNLMEVMVASMIEKSAFHGISDDTILKVYRELLVRGYDAQDIPGYWGTMNKALKAVIADSFPVI